MAQIKYPIGIQSFSEIRRGGYLYVDKTAYILKLLNHGKYFFLSRPRRFGKSLFLTTIQAYFEGRRELFEGLDIDREDTGWTVRPVFFLSLNALSTITGEGLSSLLNKALSDWEDKYGRNEAEADFPQRLTGILQRAYAMTGERSAILVDEYDAPLLAAIDDDATLESYRQTLKGIFTVLKTADEYIEFAMLTGVSRFSQTSLFSGPNNLNDITMDDRYSAICGITEDELPANLRQGIAEFAECENVTYDEAAHQLKENYDGYHFTKSSPDIYNPFSLFCALDKCEIGDYWFNSGTPTFLVKSLQNGDFYLPDLDGLQAEKSDLSAVESYNNNPTALLFETGYLTIKDYDSKSRLYTLGLPNEEVSHSFIKFMLPYYMKSYSSRTVSELRLMQNYAAHGEAEDFMTHLQSLMADIPYGNIEMKIKEKYFQNNLYLILKLIGFDVTAERQTASGRIDMVMHTPLNVYIFELKMHDSPETALEQIDRLSYALPFRRSGKTIIKIGANYSPQTNSIGSWAIEKE